MGKLHSVISTQFTWYILMLFYQKNRCCWPVCLIHYNYSKYYLYLGAYCMVTMLLYYFFYNIIRQIKRLIFLIYKTVIMINKRLASAALLLTLIFCSFVLPGKRNLNIVFIGDSITHGARLKDFTTQAPPVFATAYLQQQKQFDNVQFSNQGVSGHTTVDFLPATNKAYPKVIAAANTFYSDKNATLVFSVMLGTNDSAISGPNGAPVSPENYGANLKTIADSLLARYPECKIIINHPVWYSPNTNNHSVYLQEGLTRLQTYFAEIQALVKEYRSTNPDHVFMGDKNGFDYFRKNYLTDLGAEAGGHGTFYLHPNEKGAVALGNLWGKAIAKALK